jgi:hypothetical protein
MARGAEGGKEGDLPTYYLLFWSFFEVFYGVFELLMQGNGQKRDKKNRRGEMTGRKKSPHFFCRKGVRDIVVGESGLCP